MYTEGLVISLCLCIYLAACDFSVQGPGAPIKSLQGQAAVLGCRVSPVPPISNLEVEWVLTNTNDLLHLYSEGQERPESQSYRYRGRAEFHGDKQQGDFSLQIKNVTDMDRGMYRCIVSYGSISKEETVELIITGITLETTNLRTSVSVGENVDEYVLLPCTLKPIVPVDYLEVKWLLQEENGDQVVHLFSGGEERPDDQYFLYRDRTELLLKEISNGNLSLILKVRHRDSGTYRCTASYGPNSASSDMELYVSCSWLPMDKFALTLFSISCIICVVFSFLMCTQYMRPSEMRTKHFNSICRGATTSTWTKFGVILSFAYVVYMIYTVYIRKAFADWMFMAVLMMCVMFFSLHINITSEWKNRGNQVRTVAFQHSIIVFSILFVIMRITMAVYIILSYAFNCRPWPQDQQEAFMVYSLYMIVTETGLSLNIVTANRIANRKTRRLNRHRSAETQGEAIMMVDIQRIQDH